MQFITSNLLISGFADGCSLSSDPGPKYRSLKKKQFDSHFNLRLLKISVKIEHIPKDIQTLQNPSPKKQELTY